MAARRPASVVFAWLALLIALVCSGGFAAPAALPQESKEQKDRRMAWWREAKFGMFIHWGLYAIPAGEWKGERIPGIGEWIMFRAKIPVKEYEQLAKRFNPTKFDADAWVRLAKTAGMKYIVITAKHHDGFSMFDSKVTTYDIVDATPFKRDPMAELARACRKHGIKLCFYYSHARDWHEPDAYDNTWDFPSQERDFEGYLRRKAMPQVRELLTQYGPIGIIWFDTPIHLTEEQSARFVALVRKLQPNCLVSGRVGHGLGDYRQMGDNRIPSTVVPGDWETPATMNDTWGYKYYDNNWKSPERLIRLLVDIVSKGGNYLLNVGPTAEGEIPQPSVERLIAVGRWMRVNCSSIYGTEPSPFVDLPFDGRCTRRGNRLYLHVFTWPNGPLVLDNISSPVAEVRLLANKRALKFDQQGSKLTIYLPNEPPDPIDSVVVVQLAGPLEVDYSLKPRADGSLVLPAARATVHGRTARAEQKYGRVTNIGFWNNPRDWVSWEITIPRQARYRVFVSLACPNSVAGSSYAIEVAGKRLLAKVPGTGGWDRFAKFSVGEIKIPAGKHLLAVKPVRLAGSALMNLESVTLKPVGK